MNLVPSYALALRIMLANLRRKVGVVTRVATPALAVPPPFFVQEMIVSPTFVDPKMPAPFTMEELGFCWPNDQGIFSPSAIPVWLREQVGLYFFIIHVLDSESLALTELGGPWSAYQWGGRYPRPDEWSRRLDR